MSIYASIMQTRTLKTESSFTDHQKSMVTAYCEEYQRLLEPEALGSHHSGVFPSSDLLASPPSYGSCRTMSNPCKCTLRALKK